ncbi:hypothetical protein [Nostoc sp. WHI]|uniref:hypothetical protein n=1 Tax=Nostoc sp. WHI TaxID=2650611 RepID=UPI0018C6C1CD|nr:hypothetical protein [Nostoc sp. WHI]MBG1268964.1 hypothetical protein [Nostoc sp. WHI]MBG1270582.1 hypothetical protein [Nostoc sp. WHI]
MCHCSFRLFHYFKWLSPGFRAKETELFQHHNTCSFTARLAFGLGMLGAGLTMLLANRIEAVETGDLLQPKPIPFPCRGCRYYHGSSYGGVTLNCAIHPDGCEGSQCPDWQAFNHLNLEE